VRRGLAETDPLLRLAALEAADGLEPGLRLQLVRPLLADPVRAVRIQAASTLALTPSQFWAPSDRARLAGPLAEYRAAQAENADRPEAHLNLGVLAAASGDVERARSEYETALRLGPWFVPAYVNLADLDRQLQRDDEAERVLLRGRDIVGDNAELSHALGLTLVREGRTREAIAELARAAELAPDSARYAYVYGIALHSAGETERAREVLDAAHRRHPGDVPLLHALATLCRDAGDFEAAHEYALVLVELIPEDPGAHQLLAEIQAHRSAER